MQKVSVTRCESYDSHELMRSMEKCLDALGGIRRYVSTGETILLKPNMLSPRPPEKAVTTHPEVVRAAIKLVKGAGGVPLVGDSCSGIGNESALRNLAEQTGILAVCEQERVEFELFTESTKVPFPDGKVAKSFELVSLLKKVDGIISLAKMKTHAFTGLTGAVKNLFGLIPGLKKAEYHFRMQEAKAFSELLVDLAECVKPRLTIMDGIVGMDGDGPAGGNARNFGLILASDDVHALDAFFMEIAGTRMERVPTVEIASKRGLVPNDLAGIEVIGGERKSFRIKDFKMPSAPKTFGRIPIAMGWLVGESIARKPVFSRSKCTLCDECIETCPAKALKKGKRRPSIDRNLCFRCYCCQELCAHDAIKLKRVPLRSLASAATGRTRRRLHRSH